MRKYNIDESRDGKEYKNGRKKFILSIILGVLGIISLILGIFAQGTKFGMPIAILSAIIFMITSLILMYKSYSDMMAYESMKMEKKYEGKELYRLNSVCKYEVESKLLSAGYKREGEYLKKKRFSFLKDSITYYFRLIDARMVFGDIERVIKEFELMEKFGNCCLCLFVYIDGLKKEDLEDAKEFGKTDIVYENVINPFTQESYVLVVVDRKTNEGYFLDIGKKYKTSLYSHGCKWIKRILD